MKRVHRAGAFIKCSGAGEVSEQSKMRRGFLQDGEKILHFRERGEWSVELGVRSGTGERSFWCGALAVTRVLIQANDRSGLHTIAAIYGEV